MTHLHKVKCLECGLHFIICSWERERNSPVYCPECGKAGRQLRWWEESETPIYNFVPGKAAPADFAFPATESWRKKE